MKWAWTHTGNRGEPSQAVAWCNSLSCLCNLGVLGPAPLIGSELGLSLESDNPSWSLQMCQENIDARMILNWILLPKGLVWSNWQHSNGLWGLDGSDVAVGFLSLPIYVTSDGLLTSLASVKTPWMVVIIIMLISRPMFSNFPLPKDHLGELVKSRFLLLCPEVLWAKKHHCNVLPRVLEILMQRTCAFIQCLYPLSSSLGGKRSSPDLQIHLFLVRKLWLWEFKVFWNRSYFTSVF